MKERGLETVPLVQILEHIKKINDFAPLSETTRSNPQLFHYIQEIQRYKTTIRYIYHKTLRSFQKETEISQFAQDRREMLYFAIFSLYYEKTPIDQILHNFADVLGKSPEFRWFSTFLHRVGNFDWKIALKGKNSQERLSIQHALPSFFIQTS